MQCLRELLPSREPAEFYGRVLKSFERLSGYFEAVCREEPHIPGPPCEEVATFRRTLLTYSKTTEELELIYFRELAYPQSPVKKPIRNQYEIIDICFLARVR